MVKTKTWIIIIALLLIISGGASIFILLYKSDKTVANVYVDGKCVYSVDLSKVTESTTKMIGLAQNGYNIITIEPNRICISDADCPDKVCVSTGWISNSTLPIVCLPHKVIVKITSVADGIADGVYDNVAGDSADNSSVPDFDSVSK